MLFSFFCVLVAFAATATATLLAPSPGSMVVGPVEVEDESDTPMIGALWDGDAACPNWAARPRFTFDYSTSLLKYRAILLHFPCGNNRAPSRPHQSVFGYKKTRTAAYYCPQGNSVLERVHSTVHNCWLMLATWLVILGRAVALLSSLRTTLFTPKLWNSLLSILCLAAQLYSPCRIHSRSAFYRSPAEST